MSELSGSGWLSQPPVGGSKEGEFPLIKEKEGDSALSNKVGYLSIGGQRVKPEADDLSQKVSEEAGEAFALIETSPNEPSMAHREITLGGPSSPETSESIVDLVCSSPLRMSDDWEIKLDERESKLEGKEEEVEIVEGGEEEGEEEANISLERIPLPFSEGGEVERVGMQISESEKSVKAGRPIAQSLQVPRGDVLPGGHIEANEQPRGSGIAQGIVSNEYKLKMLSNELKKGNITVSNMRAIIEVMREEEGRDSFWEGDGMSSLIGQTIKEIKENPKSRSFFEEHPRTARNFNAVARTYGQRVRLGGICALSVPVDRDGNPKIPTLIMQRISNYEPEHSKFFNRSGCISPQALLRDYRSIMTNEQLFEGAGDILTQVPTIISGHQQHEQIETVQRFMLDWVRVWGHTLVDGNCTPEELIARLQKSSRGGQGIEGGDDFAKLLNFIQRLESSGNSLIRDEYANEFKKELYVKLLELRDAPPPLPQIAPNPHLTNSLTANFQKELFKAMDSNDQEYVQKLARDILAMGCNMKRQIPESRYYTASEKGDPSVSRSIDYIAGTPYIFASQILNYISQGKTPADQKERFGNAAKFMGDLGKELIKLNDLEGCQQLMVAFDIPEVDRLKASLASKGSMEAIDYFQSYFSVEGNQKALRSTINSLRGEGNFPIPLFLKDIIFNKDGNPSKEELIVPVNGQRIKVDKFPNLEKSNTLNTYVNKFFDEPRVFLEANAEGFNQPKTALGMNYLISASLAPPRKGGHLSTVFKEIDEQSLSKLSYTIKPRGGKS